MNNTNDRQKAARELSGLFERTRAHYPATRWREPWRPADGSSPLMSPRGERTLQQIITHRRAGLSYRQIAAAMSMSEESIDSLVYRARKLGHWPADLLPGRVAKAGRS